MWGLLKQEVTDAGETGHLYRLRLRTQRIDLFEAPRAEGTQGTARPPYPRVLITLESWHRAVFMTENTRFEGLDRDSGSSRIPATRSSTK